MAYTDITLVSAELNGLVIDDSSTPSESTVNSWIADADAEIDLRTSTKWSSTEVTDEVFDYDGTGYIKFPFSPVINVTSLAYENAGLGAVTENWVPLTEGRTNDYLLYVNEGEVELINNNVSKGKQNIKATFTYGYATTPAYISRLATLLVTKRVIGATLSASSQQGGGSISVGSISLSEPGSFSVSYVKGLDGDIADIYARIGSSKVFRGNRVYDLRY